MIHAALRRAAAVATGALLALPVAGVSPAHATSVTAPGCYGANTTFVCNPTVQVTSPYAVGTTNTTIPVCVSICQDVPVTLVTATETGPATVCVTYQNRSGVEIYRTCQTREIPDPPTAAELIATVFGVLGRYEVRECDFWEVGWEVYDTSTGRRVAGYCTTIIE